MNDDVQDEPGMEEISRAYLKRHKPHHQGNDHLLFCRAVQHLKGLGASTATAEKLVSRAYGDMKIGTERRRLDVQACTENMAVVTDPATGLTWAVPVGLIVQRVIESPDRRRLRLVPDC